MALAENSAVKIEAGLPEVSLAGPRDFYELLKPRVMQLVVFTALVGLVIAPGAINPFIAFIAVAAIAIGGGASGALNMWYDADIDAVMSRTKSRPIPSGRIASNDVLVFGLVLSFLSVMTLGLATNWVAGTWLAFTIFFYAVVYSAWLKRWTPQNIVIGGAAGAFPPIIGWAAVTGQWISLESFVLFLIVFLWTPPHFWALALLKSEEYGAAGVPMMPNVAGIESTKKQIFGYSVLLAISSTLPFFAGFAGYAYLAVAIALGGMFAFRSWQLLQANGEDANRPSIKLFLFSLWYLFALFGALLVETIIFRVMA
ncbi:MAG: heme o synthase [Notoacmeibacter sp.]